MNGLDGKVAVVTGASNGIGEATAEALSVEGAVVIVAARREDRLSDLVERIAGDGGLRWRCGATSQTRARRTTFSGEPKRSSDGWTYSSTTLESCSSRR